MSDLNPVSVLFEVMDHHIKLEQLEVSQEQLQVARTQLLLAYNRDGRDAEKLRLYQERNHMEWIRFEQQQIDYVYKLFTNQDVDYVSFTLRSMNLETAYYYLLHWLIVGKKLPEVNIGVFALVFDASDDNKRLILEAYISDRVNGSNETATSIINVSELMLKELMIQKKVKLDESATSVPENKKINPTRSGYIPKNETTGLSKFIRDFGRSRSPWG